MATERASYFYERLLFLFRNAAALIPLLMVPLGFLAREGLTDGRFYNSDVAFGAIVALYMATTGLYFLYKRQRTQNSTAVDASFLVIFHILALLFVLFVSGFLSTFLAVWIVLIINSDIRFGLRGSLTSFAALCLGGALSTVMWPTTLSNGDITEILQGAVIVGVIGFVVARIRAVADQQRGALTIARSAEAYQRERLIALINSMGDAVIATDEAGAIKVYNSSLLNLIDTNLSLMDKPIDEVLKLLDSQGHPVSIFTIAQARHTVFSRTDLSYKYADGEMIKLYINVAPIQPGYQSRAEGGYILTLRDITKEKSLEEERDEFISVVSHELRTPVTIAEGNLSNMKLLFERNADKTTMTQAVHDAHEQVMYLAKLINDLSTLARAERGTGGQAESVDIAAFLHELFTTYTPQAETKKLHLDLDVAPHLPRVTTNPLYLQEIMQNLLTNAIKYTQNGSVTLRATTDKDGLLLEVIDTGIGISKTDQQHVFEKFYRSEDYRTRESSGTGLGLYLCQKLAEKLGFALTFSSRLNHGSIFTLQIPSRFVAADQAQDASGAPA